MAFQLRPAVVADADAISALVTGWAHHFLDDPADPEAAPFLATLTPAATRERIASDEYRYDVAVDAAGLCGVIALRDRFHLFHLFVRADAHGRRVARTLWEHAKAKSGSQVFIVNSSPPAVPVYERFGFVAKAAPQTVRGLTFVPMEYGGCTVPHP